MHEKIVKGSGRGEMTEWLEHDYNPIFHFVAFVLFVAEKRF